MEYDLTERLPPPETYAVACERIRCLCALYSASETSGGRTRAHNLAVGGDPLSKHQLAYGCCGWDLVPDKPVRRTELANAARVLGFFVQVEGDHVHLQSIAPGPGSVF